MNYMTVAEDTAEKGVVAEEDMAGERIAAARIVEEGPAEVGIGEHIVVEEGMVEKGIAGENTTEEAPHTSSGIFFPPSSIPCPPSCHA